MHATFCFAQMSVILQKEWLQLKIQIKHQVSTNLVFSLYSCHCNVLQTDTSAKLYKLICMPIISYSLIYSTDAWITVGSVIAVCLVLSAIAVLMVAMIVCKKRQRKRGDNYYSINLKHFIHALL